MSVRYLNYRTMLADRVREQADVALGDVFGGACGLEHGPDPGRDHSPVWDGFLRPLEDHPSGQRGDRSSCE